MKRWEQSGFSAMEALVAVAIVAVAMVPLASLQGQVSRDAARQQAEQARLASERSALVLLRAVNPMQEPSGIRELGGGLVLHWTARPISEAAPTNAGGFDVALYRIEAQIQDSGRRPLANFAVDQVGWRTQTEQPTRGEGIP